ncbi:MAG: GNAT family N-acetyltransferase [Pseudomonadota bacterium]|nr:GNAT family N-acetyltransferase [Pseudomonadota bacterium]
MADVKTVIEPLEEVSDEDLEDLCDAAESAILDGGGFGWLKPPPRVVLGRYFRGVALVPERHLFVGRLDNRVAAAIQLQEPPRNNEAHSHAATLTTLFVAPWARGHSIGPRLIESVESRARELGYLRLNFDVRATQTDAVRLFENLGFELWGTNPAYALVDGDLIPGHYYSKQLRNLAKKKGKKKTPR